ncbi:MAG: TonB-dependent receptor [Bacteroidetes bacterium]|nr:TonB-dependent receptor [Bacteroidota bacterium]
MKRLIPFVFVFIFNGLNGQTIRGRITETVTGSGVAKALVKCIGGAAQTTTDTNGQFSLPGNGQTRFEISAEGYVTSVQSWPGVGFWEINLDAVSKDIGTATITHNRLKEKIRESPVTVESMNAVAIKETPASDFYEGLGHLRGVDVTAASLGFRVVNTRGFNSTSPVRSLQLIDGVDNQAPGLNFSLGNFLGSSELDVASTEIIVGASSAYYGPNAFNGVIKMTTKSPWTDTGFSAQLKVGERQLGQLMMRYAKSYRNKKGRDVFAWKANLNYLRAYDWVADNADPTLDSKAGIRNPGGYDAVNRYGDEVFGTASNDQVSKDSRYRDPGLGAFYRNGYWEKDLVNYNTRNFKSNVVLAYKLNHKNEIQYGFNFGTGTTVYQGDNRYSLNGILFFQNRLEWISPKGHLRFYATNEDAGNTYDAVLTAFLMQDAAKPSAFWYADYQNYWSAFISNKVKALPGYSALGYPIPGFPKYNPNFFEDQEVFLEKNRDSILRWHALARAQSNTPFDHQGNRRLDSTQQRFEPGSPEFNKRKEDITSRYSYSREGGPTGSRFFDQSAMYHATGEKRFALKEYNFTVGFSARIYRPYSHGTIFLDTGSTRITNKEAGIYGGVEKRYWKRKLKINVTARVDKNQNFPFLFSPAASVIYSKTKRHTYRLSFSSAIRNPTLQDQYLYYNVGRAILLGNINGMKNVYEVGDFINYLNTRLYDTLISKRINLDPIKPEGVRTVELGYKGFLFKNKLLIDAGYYLSFYRNFIGYRIVMDAKIDTVNNYPTSAQAYRVASNSKDIVSTQGLSAAVSWFFAKSFMVGGNWSWNVLDRMGSKDPLIPAFNTPANKFNVMLGAANLDKKLHLLGKPIHLQNCGFNFNFKWIQGYRFEGSPQFTGDVPTYWLLDFQLNQRIPKWDATFKLGASNLTNNMAFQVYGGPRIGRMAYFSITWEPAGNSR